MKFIFQILLIILLAWGFEMYLPWWSIAIGAFAGGFLLNTKSNFLAGMIAIMVLWSVQSITMLSSDVAGLTEKIASLLMVKYPAALIAVTALIGGLVGGFAALSGSILKTRKRRYRY